MHPVPETAGPREPDLRELVELCIARYPTDGPRVVEETCARYPDLAALLRRRLAILERSGLLDVAPADRSYPDRLGDFRLLELIGEGGMGAVFKAQQLSLGRLVALKVIRADYAYSTRSRERFRREIEAIAAMRSPGIVQVHVVGEDGGVPYYAMELVDGINLQDLVLELRRAPPERLSGTDVRAALARVVPRQESSSTATEASDLFDGTYVQTCCRIALRVARTLAYAHERGILHRDVKPSNVMLDRSGRVLLLDFGLARAAESEPDVLTRTGVVVGSLAYMAPEQMRGERDIDARADVYGLGVVLYELLTHRAAFRGDTQEDLRRRVLAGTVPPPAQINPAIPRDAETICLKAMAPERSQRYATAQALADDLQRFLELRPIAARRAGWIHRARRWAQRHPAKATALVAATVLVVVGPAVVALQASVARADIAAALDRAEEYRRSYERALAVAVDGMERTTIRLAQDEQLAAGKLDGLRQELLEGAAGFWQAMADVEDPHPAVRSALFRSRGVLATIRRELGDMAGARAVLDGAVAELERIRAEANPDQRLQLDQDLAKVLFEQADVMLAQQDLRGGIAALERSVALAEPHEATAVNPAAVRRHVARCRLNLAQALVQCGEADAAIATCRQVLASLPEDDDLRFRARTVLPAVLLRAGRLDEALPALEEAIAIRTERAAADPADAANLRDLKSAHHNLGQLHQQRGDLPAAQRHLEEAHAIARRLHEAFPDRIDNELTLLASTMVLGNVYLRQNDVARAEQTCRDGVARAEAVAAAHGDLREVQTTLAQMRSTLAQILIDRPQARAESVALLQAAAEAFAQLARDEESGLGACADEAVTRSLLASALGRSGDRAGSRVAEDRAFELFTGLLARHPEHAFYRGNAARLLAGSVSRALNDGDEARVRDVLERASSLGGAEQEMWSLLEQLPAERVAEIRRLRPTDARGTDR